MSSSAHKPSYTLRILEFRTTRIGKRWGKSVAWLLGFLKAYALLPILNILGRPLGDISTFARRIPFIERREYSQNGEDGIIHAIFKKIGTTNTYFVEFGVEDGIQSNARYLWKHKGWKGLMMDGSHENAPMNLQKEFITAENIQQLFAKHHVPKEFDLLSIDIDGNDYWVWEAITHYNPRVVIMEYNAHIPPTESKTIPYQADFCWDGTDYFGASLLSLQRLGARKGYTLIGTDACGVNAFFVLDALVAGNFTPQSIEELFHPPAYKGKKGNGHPADTQNRPWQEIV